MNKAIKNRDKFLKHIGTAYPFAETGAAGSYYEKGLKAEMTVTGNEVSFRFRKEPLKRVDGD